MFTLFHPLITMNDELALKFNSYYYFRDLFVVFFTTIYKIQSCLGIIIPFWRNLDQKLNAFTFFKLKLCIFKSSEFTIFILAENQPWNDNFCFVKLVLICQKIEQSSTTTIQKNLLLLFFIMKILDFDSLESWWKFCLNDENLYFVKNYVSKY